MGLSALLLAGSFKSTAQDNKSDDFKPHGKLWGYAFGDFAYKGATDDANRGGANQYSRVPVNSNIFQFRRVYLGYSYDISKTFTAEFLLAAEDDFASGVLGQTNGDVLVNNKFTPYLKLANLRWKNIFKNSDLVIGQAPTPTFAMGASLAENARNTQTPEEVWGYRSIERTITDIRRTSSYDLGVALQGWFDQKGNYGYDVMVANGQGDKPENDPYKWFYGDVYAKFFNKRLIVDFYQDYARLNWNQVRTGIPETVTSGGTGPVYSLPAPAGLHHDRNMSKIFVAWTDKKFTVGVEAFRNTIMGDIQAVGTDHKVYYLTSQAIGISTYVRGAIYKDKLGFFARYDNYNPTHNMSAVTDNVNFTSYSALSAQYEPTTKEQFITFGLDFKPMKNVHIMPNMWINTYESAITPGGRFTSAYNPNITGSKGTDAVYRLTFYYIYGK